MRAGVDGSNANAVPSHTLLPASVGATNRAKNKHMINIVGWTHPVPPERTDFRNKETSTPHEPGRHTKHRETQEQTALQVHGVGSQNSSTRRSRLRGCQLPSHKAVCYLLLQGGLRSGEKQCRGHLNYQQHTSHQQAGTRSSASLCSSS